MVVLPIYVSGWEIECCQPDITVGERWLAFPIFTESDGSGEVTSGPTNGTGKPVGLIEANIRPHRLSEADAPVIELNGLAIASSAHLESAATVTGHLFNDAHYCDETYNSQYPLLVEGIVRRLYGMKFRYKDGSRISQAVTQLVTSARGGQRDRYYDEFLMLLEVAGQELPEASTTG